MRSNRVKLFSGVSVWVVVVFKRHDSLSADFRDEIDSVLSDCAGVMDVAGCALQMTVIFVEPELTGRRCRPEVSCVIFSCRCTAAANAATSLIPGSYVIVEGSLCHGHPMTQRLRVSLSLVPLTACRCLRLLLLAL